MSFDVSTEPRPQGVDTGRKFSRATKKTSHAEGMHGYVFPKLLEQDDPQITLERILPIVKSSLKTVEYPGIEIPPIGKFQFTIGLSGTRGAASSLYMRVCKGPCYGC